ncbi:MAG: nuclear transport factor 2 family protein [Rhizobacter sp.]
MTGPSRSHMHAEFEPVAAVLRDYFEGLYRSDTQILRRVFHPSALYACATDGSLLALGMDAYFPVVDKRPSPASRGEARADSIISIEFAGPVTALARVECAILPKRFTDLLTLVKLDGRWQIIAKVFHYELEGAVSGPQNNPR